MKHHVSENIKHINFQIGFQKDSVDEIIATRLQGFVGARFRIARHFVEANPTDPTHVMIVSAFQGFRVQVLEWFYTHLRVFFGIRKCLAISAFL